VLELAEAVQQSWRTVLGIEVEIQSTESRTHWANLQVKQYDLSIAGWNADYPDASTFLDLFVANGGWNFTNWGDPAYDALLDASSAELDPAKRLATLQAAEAKLLEAMPIIPLTNARARALIQPSVRDWPENVLDRADYVVPWLKAD
jgi:oligopeptide transport system substrate-binding protein